MRHTCNETQYNDLATVFMANKEAVLAKARRGVCSTTAVLRVLRGTKRYTGCTGYCGVLRVLRGSTRYHRVHRVLRGTAWCYAYEAL